MFDVYVVFRPQTIIFVDFKRGGEGRFQKKPMSGRVNWRPLLASYDLAQRGADFPGRVVSHSCPSVRHCVDSMKFIT